MDPPYPADIVPLLPAFLQRRRTKLDLPLRLVDELGIDRPSLMMALQLTVTAPEGATIDELLFPYSVRREHMRGMLAAAEGAGLVREGDGGRFMPTERALDLARQLQVAAHTHLGALAPIARPQLDRLAALCESAFQASAAAAPAVPHAHVPRAWRFREGTASTHPMVALENAIYGLWMARDDCHVAAWLARGLSGPDLDVLTRVWRDEAASAEALAALLGHGSDAHVTGSLGRLRAAGLVRPDAIRVTEAGRAMREAIEADTDDAFFAPWPPVVGSEAAWIRERLAEVNAALA